MSAQVRCKACGFLMPDGVYDECPACGVPSKMFEPFEDKVPENRRKVLEMHLHPVITHAPQGLGFLVLILMGIYTVLAQISGSLSWRDMLLPTIQVMSILLPLTTFAGLLSGMLDGKYRYKRLDTKLLRKKILVGSTFLALSIGMGVLAFLPGFAADLAVQVAFLVLNAGAFACSVILGWWGAALNQAIMPGPFMKKKK